MNNRKRVLAVLNYKNYDRLPVVHFGFWRETLQKWAIEGHITQDIAKQWNDGNNADSQIGQKLGFDCGWFNCVFPNVGLKPCFQTKVLKVRSDGCQEVLNEYGVVELVKPGVVSIASEIDHLLKERDSWNEHYLPRLQYSQDRISNTLVNISGEMRAFDAGGLAYLQDASKRDNVLGLYCGSIIGKIRDWFGIEGLSYVQIDDPELFCEIIDHCATLDYKVVNHILEMGAKFDFAHFWEDICFKSGPLVSPAVFRDKIGHHYKRITDLIKSYGINIISVDCDGLIDSLIPVWLENGVNTMFPIEVGTWNASIKPWREKYGKQIRGVGGMNKVVFAYDYAAIDAEIERLKPLIELGGYIPCPDHRIAPDAKWENVQYYCDKIHKRFE